MLHMTDQRDPILLEFRDEAPSGIGCAVYRGLWAVHGGKKPAGKTHGSQFACQTAASRSIIATLAKCPAGTRTKAVAWSAMTMTGTDADRGGMGEEGQERGEGGAR